MSVYNVLQHDNNIIYSAQFASLKMLSLENLCTSKCEITKKLFLVYVYSS